MYGRTNVYNWRDTIGIRTSRKDDRVSERSVKHCYTSPGHIQKYTDFPKIWMPSQNSRRKEGGKFHAEDPQILSATVQNLVAWTTCRPGYQQSIQYISGEQGVALRRFIVSLIQNHHVYT
jgi:hypothetical protein